MDRTLQDLVRQSAKNLGFHLAGIAPIGDFDDAAGTPPELGYFEKWVSEGRAGEMEYLKRRDPEGRLLRSSARIPFPWARSVIVCAVVYNSDQPYSIDPVPSSSNETPGWIARYAWSGKPQETSQTSGDTIATSSDNRTSASLVPTDYHGVIRPRLEQLRDRLQESLGEFQSRCFVDTSPLIERVYAKYAGLGWEAKNTCLINQELGSWFFLGVIVTSLELPREQWTAPMPDRCGSCTRCIDACPTEALEPYRMDASRCISYMTIEKRGELPGELAGKIGRHVFGCDICQEVCPWNDRGSWDGKDGRRSVPLADWPELQARPELVNPPLKWLDGLDTGEFRRLFRGSSLERAKVAGLRRNIANARNNCDSQRAETVPEPTHSSSH